MDWVPKPTQLLLFGVVIVEHREVQLQSAVKQLRLVPHFIRQHRLLVDRPELVVSRGTDRRSGARLIPFADREIEQVVRDGSPVDANAPGHITLVERIGLKAILVIRWRSQGYTLARLDRHGSTPIEGRQLRANDGLQ